MQQSNDNITKINSRNDRWVWRYEGVELSDPFLIDKLFAHVCEQANISQDDTTLRLVLSELVANAIEHGVLGLDSAIKDSVAGFDSYYREKQNLLSNIQHGWVKITIVQLQGDLLRIEVQDSGEGFDHSLANWKQMPAMHALFGRGLCLVAQICESMRFLDDGNAVVIEYLSLQRFIKYSDAA